MGADRPIAFRPALVPLVGDHVGALVLSQIMYWHTGRLRVRYRGRFWLAKSRAAMCDECQITLDQYKRVIPLLVTKGWILSERHLFAGRVTPFIRLTDKGEEFRASGALPLVVAVTNPLVALGPNQLVATDPNQLVAKPTILYTESTTESTTEITYKALAPPALKTQEPEMNADEILKSFGNKQVEGTGLQAMSITWRKEVGLFGAGQAFVKNLTLKEVGQLKHVHKALPDKAVEIVKYVVRNWPKFAAEVQALKGVSAPLIPVIGFFSQHYEIALQLIAPKPQAVFTPAPIIAAALPQAVPPADLATQAEIQATMDEIAAIQAMKKKGLS